MIGKRTRLILLFSAFLVILAVLHFRGLDAPLYYDSVYLAENEYAFVQGPLQVLALFPQRPAAMLSFYLNYCVTGLSPEGFRIINGLLIAGTAFLVSLITLILLRISYQDKDFLREIQDSCASADRVSQNSLFSFGPGGSDRDIVVCAIVTGLFFLIHPVQVFLVLYAWQRMAILAAFFYCAAFLAYLCARIGFLRPAWAGYFLAGILFLLAVASKENAITLPGIIVLAELAFFRVTWKTAFKEASILAIGLVALLAVFSFLERPHGEILQDSGILTTVRQYYRESGISLPQIVLNQCRMVFEYIALILFPDPDRVQFISPQVISRSFFESLEGTASVAGTGILILSGVILLWKRPMVGFGILFFLVNLLPEALLVPQYLFISYRALLPMVGLLVAAADTLLWVWRSVGKLQMAKSLRAALAVGLLLGFSFTGASTWAKVDTWSNPLALWTEVVNRMPEDYTITEKHGTMQALNTLGIHLQREGRNQEAIDCHLRALQVSPGHRLTYIALGNAYAAAGHNDEAEQAYGEALAAKRDADKAHVGMGMLLLKQGRTAEARIHVTKAMALSPHNPEYRNLMATIDLQEGKYTDAMVHLRKALELKPDYAEAEFHLGKVFSRLGSPNDAAVHFSRAITMNPKHWQARNDLGILLAKSGRAREAVAHFQQALALNPEDPAIRANLKTALEQAGLPPQ
ncbi:tetratricopeptide repeat protein [Desulfomonile tiedjei]|uniref:Flp pilus assembly protein TadD n=1 Tax=Desulfomonile tiedjei (strain ATCC 49306 / DSM 6799 / DCB-1) TaxID=706587 RepID=I4CAS4_DESTA|nr:tetratricopeptide repeat protein [Desulfomonile tiedjei]AFM26665.1 Flp pilus assembly protein TadD [Desulfomonile tiedjei DSM 6799]